MAEADKETAKSEQPAAEPDLIEGEPEEEGDGMVIAVSRGVGLAARTMSDGLQSVVDLFRPRRDAPVAKPVDKPEELIAALAELVAATGGSYAELEQQQDFWELIERLYRVHRRKRVQRHPDEEAPRGRRLRKKVKAKAEALEAEAKAPTKPPEEKPAEAKEEEAPKKRSKRGSTTESAKAKKKAAAKAKAESEEEYEDVLAEDDE
jgi:hypothetical protein